MLKVLKEQAQIDVLKNPKCVGYNWKPQYEKNKTMFKGV